MLTLKTNSVFNSNLYITYCFKLFTYERAEFNALLSPLTIYRVKTSLVRQATCGSTSQFSQFTQQTVTPYQHVKKVEK